MEEEQAKRRKGNAEEDIEMNDETEKKKSDYVWSLEDAQSFLKESELVYKDQKLYTQVHDKVKIVEKLKKQLRDMMEKKHDTKIIREYLNEMREIENVDFH